MEEPNRFAPGVSGFGAVAGAAHDFNVLLTVILGYSELLLADVDAIAARQSAIEEIQKAGECAARLSRQLLAFSRRQLIEPTVIDLNVVVSSMRGMFARLVGEERSVVIELCPSLAPVTADRGQLEQIIMNLAANARDAMPNGGTLTIETSAVELADHSSTSHLPVGAGLYTMLTVTDTGTGMTPQVLENLFKPFFTTKEPSKGTGLGLATVYRIVEGAQGTINVSSRVGRGTSMSVYFPRADAAKLLVDAPSSPRAPAGTETVLVVDDEVAIRLLVKRLLERQGYTVLIAEGADDALRTFEENPSIDVVLVDAVMPGISGPELMTQLVKRRTDVRVIFMSGYSASDIAELHRVTPAMAFLDKPFTSEELARTIRDVLDR